MRAALMSRAFWNSHPPIAVHSRKLLIRGIAFRVDGKMSPRIEMKLAIPAQSAGRRIRAHRPLDVEVRPVDLRAIPPMRLGVAIGRGLALIRR